jgi:hypothetical protein
MALQYVDLSPATRRLMIEELNLDLGLNKLYQGKRLTTGGLQEWPTALRSAFEYGTDDSLAAWLSQPWRLEQFEVYTVKGIVRSRKVPVTAAQTFAEGEFNRFYIRAVCRQAVDRKVLNQGDDLVTAYRARYSEKPRPESVSIDGKQFDAKSVLADLRENTSSDGVNTALGMPPGPNSGMSVKL